jgi:prepilin-type N-terminal cleavage/methylation domain-containing protein
MRTLSRHSPVTLRRAGARRGASLPELLVALVVLGIIGTASVRLLMSQTSFYDVQLKQRAARNVSRAAVNMMLSDIRMVESTGGVESATSTSVTLRVPYAMGMACGTVGPVSVIALLPTDSTVVANATPAGHAWRDVNGSYTYTNGSVATITGGTGLCAFASISAVPGGRVIAMSPALPAGANPGDAVFLYQRIRYEFKSSDAMPGRLALWRTDVDADTHEELAAPFEASAHFRFFQFNRDTSDATATASDVRGLELVLNGESRYAASGESAKERSPFRTAVFFNNRVN